MLVIISPNTCKELPHPTRVRRKPRSYNGPAITPKPIARKTCMLPIQEIDEAEEDESVFDW